ncbi:MAG: histidine triad nucleotide-binding protein [Firmicutes bacterium]|jgi:histidine triad (HIT) family protein|nr:histidine triad nucleotide-binding protein [Bacillota bacterium]
MDCIFCKIANKEIPATIVYEDDYVLAFKDLNPVAPQHVLIIPKKHIASLNDLSQEDEVLMGKVILVASKLAKELGIDDAGYRIVSNCGKNGGQTVGHIHYHLLGGRELQWPPG